MNRPAIVKSYYSSVECMERNLDSLTKNPDDDYRRELVMEDGTAIPFDSLISITGVQNP